MKIAAYVFWRQTCGGVTGVGRHMRSMVLGMSRVPGVDVTVLASRRELPAPNAAPGDPATNTPLMSLPRVGLPFSRAILERVWFLVDRPRPENYVPDADWIYTPTEVYIPTKRAGLVTTVHDTEVFEDDLPWSGQHPTWNKARRNKWLKVTRTLKRARVFLAVSEFTRQRMVEVYKLAPEQITVVGNGVDQFFFDAANDPETDRQAQEWREKYGTYFATVGGFSQRKGAPYLFDLADELRRRGGRAAELKIVVSGRNDEEPMRQRQAQTPNVIAAGFVPDEKLPGFLRGAAALLVLSRYEGFGIPVVEGMASGTPVVVASFASLPEVAGAAGIIVDVSKPAEMADVVTDLAENASRRAALIEKGYSRARQFTWDACVARAIDAIRRAS